MFQEGYENSESLMDIFGPTQRRMAFRLRVPEPESSIIYRVKGALNKLSQRAEEQLFREHFFEWLEGKRNDVPFEFRFHFWEDEPEDGVEGYDVEVVAKPVLLQKVQQGFFKTDDESVEETDIEVAVATCKQRITEVMNAFGIQPYMPPHTEAEFLEHTLTNAQRELLQDSEYGRYTIDFIDEGDEALRNGLYNASMSCYIHGIEWVIIDYFQREKDEDLVEQEKQGKELYYFRDLVNRLDETPASQKTIDRLAQMNANERRWIAHHKSGQAMESDVRRVQDPLQVLLSELSE